MEVKYRFGTISKVALVGVGLACDIIGIILLLLGIGAAINTIIGVLFALFSGFIFLLIGVPLFSGRRLKVWGGSMLIELFPFLNVLPSLTFSMLWLIHRTNVEDRAKAQSEMVEEEPPLPENATRFPTRQDIKPRNNDMRRAA